MFGFVAFTSVVFIGLRPAGLGVANPPPSALKLSVSVGGGDAYVYDCLPVQVTITNGMDKRPIVMAAPFTTAYAMYRIQVKGPGSSRYTDVLDSSFGTKASIGSPYLLPPGRCRSESSLLFISQRGFTLSKAGEWSIRAACRVGTTDVIGDPTSIRVRGRTPAEIARVERHRDRLQDCLSAFTPTEPLLDYELMRESFPPDGSRLATCMSLLDKLSTYSRQVKNDDRHRVGLQFISHIEKARLARPLIQLAASSLARLSLDCKDYDTASAAIAKLAEGSAEKESLMSRHEEMLSNAGGTRGR